MYETHAFFTYIPGDGSLPHRVWWKREQFLFPGKLRHTGILRFGLFRQRGFQLLILFLPDLSRVAKAGLDVLRLHRDDFYAFISAHRLILLYA